MENVRRKEICENDLDRFCRYVQSLKKYLEVSRRESLKPYRANSEYWFEIDKKPEEIISEDPTEMESRIIQFWKENNFDVKKREYDYIANNENERYKIILGNLAYRTKEIDASDKNWIVRVIKL